MALLWLLTPSIQGVTSRLGMESTISAFFIVFLFYKVTRFIPLESGTWQDRVKQMLPIGLVGALTILSRLDNIFLVGMAGIWLVFRRPKLNGLLLADMAFCYLIPIIAAFWRLKPGAEYYQYSASVYVVLAVSMIAKPVLFEWLGVYKNRSDGTLISLFLRVTTSLVLSYRIGFCLIDWRYGFGRTSGVSPVGAGG